MLETKVGILLHRVALLTLITAGLASAISPPTQNVAAAEDLYKHTDYEGSLALLDKHSSDPAVLFLMGRNYFMLGEFKKSTDFLQKVTTGEPNNSEYMDWLGRAFGKRAETSNPLSAPLLASKARQAFERAVELDPNNKEALSDLFDYYLEAPGFLGGGYDKAYGIARRTAAIDPPEAYFEKARLAQKRQEFSAAEQQLRQAIAVAPHQVGHMIALAKFLANQGRLGESDEVFRAAEKVDPNAPEVWFARADVLIKQKRDLAEAKGLLEKYMHALITVDDPPKQDAARLLKQVGGA